jgi:3-hydroxyisobutyrate dehydrogenase-like beta-hydroxyacid dehydrogenase
MLGGLGEGDVVSAATQVGFVGVGQMGRPMVDRLVGGGFAVSVFVRRPEVAAELSEAGVTVASSVEELAGSVDVLCACTFSDAQLRSVLIESGALGAMRSGATFVNHVTGSPRLAGETAAMAPPGVHIVDAPMSGVVENIRQGSLTLLVGAEAEDLERVRPVLAAYADPIIHVGPVGHGQRVKLVNNLLFTVHLRLAVEAVGLGAALDLPPTVLAEAVGQCSGASAAVAILARLPAEAVVPGARPYLVKDVQVINDVAAELGIDLGLLGDLAGWIGTEPGVDGAGRGE